MNDFELIKEILAQSDFVNEILIKLNLVGFSNYYICGDCLAKIVWNYLSNNDLAYEIEEINFSYYDSSDLSKLSEDAMKGRLESLFSNLNIHFKVRNEARTHLEYKEKFGMDMIQYSSLEEAISSAPTTATSIGARFENGEILLYAPFGVSDILNKIVRLNKKQVNKDLYYNKVNEWVSIWSDLVIVPWDSI